MEVVGGEWGRERVSGLEDGRVVFKFSFSFRAQNWIFKNLMKSN